MALTALIHGNLDRLIGEWAAYAKTHIAATEGLTDKEIENSSRTLLAVIADDMREAQSNQQRFDRSQGACLETSTPIVEQASEHADTRVAQGFSLPELTSEFRAARASVMRLIESQESRQSIQMSEVERFNEAIDEALTASICRFDLRLNKARDMFLGVLGHDLRNPLSAILNSARLLLHDEALSPASTKYSARIYSSGKRVQGMVDDLLDFTRTRLGRSLPVALAVGDMGETVGQVIEELRIRHPAASLLYETSGDLQGRWDFGRLAQVVSNLGGNAIQHGDNAHPVFVRLEGLEERIVLSVHNEGPPIDSQTLRRIFDPLTRGSVSDRTEQTGSIGLGLYICQQITLAHGGTIDVTSQEDGTTFVVVIPRHVEPRRRSSDA